MEKLGSYVFTPSKPKGFYLDPRSKFLFMVYMSIALILFSKDILIVGILATIPFILLIINRQYKISIIYGGLFSLGLIACYYNSYWNLPALLNAIVMLLMALVVRLFPAFMLGYYIIESTSSRDFIGAMKKWRISDKVIIPVAVVFRFLPTIREESESIKKAMKMRGIKFANKFFFRQPLMYIEYRIVPLMISIAKIGEELSAAALTRGLTVGVKRSSIAQIAFGIWDFLLLIICIGISILGVLKGML